MGENERIATAESGATKLELIANENLVTGIEDFVEQVGAVSTLEADLLFLASSVYATDLAFRRGDRELFTRSLTLSLPVVNVHAFRAATAHIQKLLYLLSNDYWNIEFVTWPGAPVQPSTPLGGSASTLLFSGGLDSLAAAVQMLKRSDELLLASHFTGNPVTSGSQIALNSYLSGVFPTLRGHIRVRIGGRNRKGFKFPSDAERESTQRTRSFVFLAIAGLVAWRLGNGQIVYIAENGQLAINLPLTASRIGAFSTHTAHPSVLTAMEQLLSGLFDYGFSIVNPFLYMTKAEAISILYPEHVAAIDHSVSCWKSSRQSAHHCGECIPCLVRRIAIEYRGGSISGYRRDILSESLNELPESDSGKVNLGELMEFIANFGGSTSDHELIEKYPELISSHFELDNALEMYRRFAAEALNVFRHYPKIGSLL
jgi:7-cyano-7-deazaguanine synthase in queuosine biosynthesis